MPIDAEELEGRFVELREEIGLRLIPLEDGAHYANVRTATVADASVYRQEYPQPTLWQHLNTIQSCNAQKLKDLLLGEWKTTEEEPDIKAERGGALDEFLDEFKPQTTPERSDKQK